MSSDKEFTPKASEIPTAETAVQGSTPAPYPSIDKPGTSKESGKKANDTSLQSDEVIRDRAKVDFTEGGSDKYKFYPDNPESHRHKYRWVNKEPSKFYDPCEESRQASINCLLRNQSDKTLCQDFFDAYTECKTDFFNKKKKDRRQGKGGWGIWD